MSISVIILTYNEELHIERAIKSASKFSNNIFVVDSYSSDNTIEIAKKNGAKIFQRKFDNQARQFNWALENIEIKTEWIMRLDADEIIEDDLSERLKKEIEKIPKEVVGINLKRKHIFLGRWIRHGGRYPVTLLRIWRTGNGKVEDKWMDEHVEVFGGRTIIMPGGFSDENLKDISYFTEKHNKYASREAIEFLLQKYQLRSTGDTDLGAKLNPQAATKRYMKEKIYNKLPFWVGPIFYFSYRMTFQLGFMDGKEGLIYHFLQGFWYRFLVGSKIFEIEKSIHPSDTKIEIKNKIEAYTGIKL